MALKITEECTNCMACEPECPNKAITMGQDIFEIDPDLCTECVGFFDEQQCVAVCPVDCCVQDDEHVETEEQLIEKAKRSDPDKDFSGDIPSHFR